MKKMMLVALSLLLCLCGCATQRQESAAEQIVQATSLPFSFSGVLTLDELEQPVGITVTGGDPPVMELTAPEAVAGLRLEFDEGIVRVSYRDLMMNLTSGDLPQYSVFAQLAGMLSSLPVDAANVRREGDGLAVQGRSAAGAFTMDWDSSGTRLLRIGLPDAGAMITIDETNEKPSF